MILLVGPARRSRITILLTVCWIEGNGTVLFCVGLILESRLCTRRALIVGGVVSALRRWAHRLGVRAITSTALRAKCQLPDEDGVGDASSACARC